MLPRLYCGVSLVQFIIMWLPHRGVRYSVIFSDFYDNQTIFYSNKNVFIGSPLNK